MLKRLNLNQPDLKIFELGHSSLNLHPLMGWKQTFQLFFMVFVCVISVTVSSRNSTILCLLPFSVRLLMLLLLLGSNKKFLTLPEAACWIRQFPPHLWATEYIEGTRFGHLTANIVESLNSWLLEASGLPIIQTMECTRRRLMAGFNEWRNTSMQWSFC